MGRMYPTPPVDPTGWRRNRWKSVDPGDVPAHVTMVPSVTNALSTVYKNLTGYGGEHAIRAGYENGWPDDVEKAVEMFKWAANKHRDARQEAGTRAHTLAERLTLDLPLPTAISEEDEAFADAYMSFWKDHAPEPLHVEATVYGDGYAGTGDVIAKVDSVATVIDWKTRAAVDDKKVKRYGLLYESVKMQLAALAHADHVAVPDGDGWRLEDPPFVVQAAGVVLLPDGTYRTEWLDAGELSRWYDGFQGALRLWRAMKMSGVTA